MMRLCLFFSLIVLISAQELEIEKSVSISDANRLIDISSQVTKYVTELSVSNDGNRDINYIVYSLSADEAKYVAFIGATADGNDSPLMISHRINVKGQPTDVISYKIELLSPISSGSNSKVKVVVVLSQYLNPHPTHITQAETQFVVYEGNGHVLSPYSIKKESTTVVLYPGQVESYTKLEKSKQEGEKVEYGPYENTKPFTTVPIRIHYENNAPFVVVTELERVIEVSHWGNIAIEERISMLHKGAVLKGSFSRLDFQMDQRGRKQPSVKGYMTLLPSAAEDVYYRDEIGNISTSNMRQTDDSVEMDIRPRFPLFGGWKTNYVIGYNLPSYEYLFSSGNQFALRMRFLDHIFDNCVVEHATVRVILPEGAKNIKLNPPYKVKRSPDELHFTYLDTIGRPVIVTHKKNLVEQHINEFTLHYDFDRSGLWREPFIAIGAFYILFLAVIIYVRFDFTIASDASSENRLKVQSLVEQLSDLHGQRLSLYDKYLDLLNKFKQNKDMATLSAAKKKTESELKSVTGQIGDLHAEMKANSPEVTEKISDIQRLDKLTKEALTSFQQQMERLVSGKLGKSQFSDVEKQFKQKFDELKDRMDGIVYGL